MNWKLPFDIPLVTPTLGLPIVIYDALLIIVFVVHIVFIYTLLGSSLASVLYNAMGVFKKSKEYDELAKRLTTFTTISENAGALWGVAPLLIIGVLYTSFFYTTMLRISPHILHIIYGNIFGFLLSYAYKFTWDLLKEHKGFHIAIGVATAALFFSLPFVFMSMTNLYMQPELFSSVQDIWDIMLTPLTTIRLFSFFLTAFSFFGAVMIFFASTWKDPEDKALRQLAIDQGRKWIILSAPLNIIVTPLVLFAFSPRIGEHFVKTPFVVLPFISAAILFYVVLLLIRDFKKPEISRQGAMAVLVSMVVVVLSMATARQGIRVVSFAEPMEIQAAATKKYMANALEAYQEHKAAEKNKPAADSDPAKALAQAKGCLACHSVEMRLVGPAYKEVARKYSSIDEIVPSILNGSQGKWPEVNGAIMPANKTTVNLSKEDAEKLARWILNQ